MYTDEQLAFINYDGSESLILSATAGSGKSHSAVGRLNKMIEMGVDPSRIIFFSFTNDAVNELKSRIKVDVKITTIHSFTTSTLAKLGLFKPIVTFFDFANWYRDKYRPNAKDPIKIKQRYAQTVDKFYEEGGQISATFSAYKLQNADGVRVPKPPFYDEYAAFIKEVKGRDFSDMLIDTEKISKNPKYRSFFEGMYDYVFVDEYQDTSTLQMKILLTIKAKQYHLCGDKNQCIIHGSDVLTSNGYKKIQDLTTDDYVITCFGSNKIGEKRITNISKSEYSGDLVEIITQSGKKIITTPNHTHFSGYNLPTENKYLVYLMYKNGLGYRIGKTEIYSNNNKNKFGFKLRLHQEHADKIWILSSHNNLTDALVNEDVYSLTYGLPKAVFNARNGQNQEQINRLFNIIDTHSNAYRLLKDLHYNINQPHHIPKTHNKDMINMYIKLCEDGRQKNRTIGSVHTLQIHGSGDYYREYFENNGYKTAKDKNGWRIRKQSTDLNSLMSVVGLMTDKINLVLYAKFNSKTYQQLPAAQLLPGMSVMIVENGILSEELVIEKNIINKTEFIYDIDVENTHNLIVNGIVTHNSIYGFSGANCEGIENLLMSKYKVKELTLTKNFRSKKHIVENANKYSDLKAIPHHLEDGYVHGQLIDEDTMYDMMEDGKPLTILARANRTIKEIERHCLKNKVKMKYFNFISPQDIQNIRNGKINPSLKKKLESVAPYHRNTQNMIAFIEENQDSDVFITSIHKSKGREFERCIVINSVDPELLMNDEFLDPAEYSYITDSGDIDIEARNVHYVAVTRPKSELYFLIYE